MAVTLEQVSVYLAYKPFYAINNRVVGILDIYSLHAKYISKFENVKLVLRPLSDLFKEIEHEGERFIPIEKLKSEFLDCENIIYYENDFGVLGFGNKKNKTYFMPIFMDNEIMYECHFGIAKQLHKWWFDTENMIKNGDAVDINTINHG